MESNYLYGDKLVKSGNTFFPEAVTDYAVKVDNLYAAFFIISIFFIILIVSLAVAFTVIYRRKKVGQLAIKQISHHNALEIFWSVVPLMMVMVLFFIGFYQYLNSQIIPKDALEYKVTGRKWSWTFEYPREGLRIDDGILVVPVNRSIKLLMTSADVLHSFYIPNFRIKKDTVPNHYTTLWFKANQLGEYQVFCAEYCGDQHSLMLAKIRVVSEKNYLEFLAEKKAEQSRFLPPRERGEKIYQQQCVTCHSLDGLSKIGPSWLNLYNSERVFNDGSKAIADENYLKEAIQYPAKKIVKGYANAMPSYIHLTDSEVEGLIEYIKSLNK